MLLPLGSLPSQGAEVKQEYKLKAAYLFNFARFISFPSEAMQEKSEVLNFCVIGPNPFSNILSKLESKRINNRQIQVHYLNDRPSELQCHLAFFSKSTENRMDTLDWTKPGKHTINVSDMPGFVDAGGDVEFVVRRDRLQFIINNTVLMEKGLRPRASLLELAAEIR